MLFRTAMLYKDGGGALRYAICVMPVFVRYFLIVSAMPHATSGGDSLPPDCVNGKFLTNCINEEGHWRYAL